MNLVYESWFFILLVIVLYLQVIFFDCQKLVAIILAFIFKGRKLLTSAAEIAGSLVTLLA